jgi:ribosome-associated protein
MIQVTNQITIPPTELEERFVRSPGPGGQHVNKAATAVELRFDAKESASLSDPVRRRLLHLAGQQASKEGVIIIQAHRYRERERNREDARQRLVDLIRRAAAVPRTRRRTRPPARAKHRRLENKRKRGERKRLRRKPEI